MNRDIRLSVDFWQHPKTVKLERRLGLAGIKSLQILWCWAAQNRPDGTLSGMDDEDIAIAAHWNDDPSTLVAGLLECRYLGSTQGGHGGRTVHLHDWEEHQPYVVKAKQRREQAQKAAAARYDKKRAADSNADSETSNADSPDEQCPLPDPVPDPPPMGKQGAREEQRLFEDNGADKKIELPEMAQFIHFTANSLGRPVTLKRMADWWERFKPEWSGRGIKPAQFKLVVTDHADWCAAKANRIPKDYLRALLNWLRKELKEGIWRMK